MNTLCEHRFKAMGSLCQLSFYADDLEQVKSLFLLCEQEAKRFETCYSRYLTDSILGCVNQGQRVKMTPEFSALIKYADTAYQQSDGLFDITSGVLRKAWDFKSNQLPKQALIESLLEGIGWSRVVEWNIEQSRHTSTSNAEKTLAGEPLTAQAWVGKHFSIPPGMEIDLGGIVKEYAADALGQLARKQGITQGLVNLAGDIYVIGPHPNLKPWLIKIQHPRNPKTILGSIQVSQGAVASSGDYERFMVIDKKRYCHIINPITGWPTQGVSAVSVAAPYCIIAGTMATTAMLLGPKQGKAYLIDNGVEHIFSTI